MRASPQDRNQLAARLLLRFRQRGRVERTVVSTPHQGWQSRVNDFKEAGVCESSWNALNLPRCACFHRLHAGGFIDTEKMISLKIIR